MGLYGILIELIIIILTAIKPKYESPWSPEANQLLI